MTTFTPLCYSVEPIESSHPKCNDLTQGITSEKRSRHTYFLAEFIECNFYVTYGPWADLQLFQTRFVIGWENIRDGDITMSLFLKTIGSASYRDQWNKRFGWVQLNRYIWCSSMLILNVLYNVQVVKYIQQTKRPDYDLPKNLVAFKRLKTMENYKPSSQKVVASAYETIVLYERFLYY